MPGSTILWVVVPPAVLLAATVVFFLRSKERS